MNISKTKFDELIKIQRLYRQGKIKEKDIPKDQLEELKKLYHEQIEYLKKSIEEDKEKILRIKKEY